MISNPPLIPSDLRFAAITSAAAFDDSTKCTMRAPRLKASIPTAPVPAYKSIQVESANAAGFPAHNTLNSVSRSRSDVGRISSPGSDRSKRRRYSPAITLINLIRFAHSSTARPCLLRDAFVETGLAPSLQASAPSLQRRYRPSGPALPISPSSISAISKIV